jgi:hypothetical protein
MAPPGSLHRFALTKAPIGASASELTVPVNAALGGELHQKESRAYKGCTHGQSMSLLHRHAVFTSEILGQLPCYPSGRVLACISICDLLSLMWLFYCTGSFTM